MTVQFMETMVTKELNLFNMKNNLKSFKKTFLRRLKFVRFLLI